MQEIIKEVKEIRKQISINNNIVDTKTSIRLYDVEKQLEALIIPIVSEQSEQLIDFRCYPKSTPASRCIE